MGAAEREALLQDAQLREQVGADIESEQQGMLDIGYEDYLRQINYQKDQLNFYNTMMRGMPSSMDTTQQLYMARDPIQDTLGAGISALGTYNAMKD